MIVYEIILVIFIKFIYLTTYQSNYFGRVSNERILANNLKIHIQSCH